MFDTMAATEAAPGGSNDDFHLAGDQWALVLDGVSQPPADDGCLHGVRWFVTHLGGHLAHGLATAPGQPLTELLRTAITATCADHGPGCDLTNPLSPASTAAITRRVGGRLDWLVLGDATVAWQLHGGVTGAVTDDRADRVAGPVVTNLDVPRYDLDYVRQVRNTPEGWWVASAAPDAADHALTGTLPADDVTLVGLYSDGVTRLVERYDHTWANLLTTAPRDLIDVVRNADQAVETPGRWRGKPSDDATAVIARLRRP